MASTKFIQFPEKLLLGTGSSAYQIEGGWDADGKSASIWDEYFHSGKNQTYNSEASDGSVQVKHPNMYSRFYRASDVYNKNKENEMTIVNGDVACDSYHKLDEDVQNLIDLGVNVYRFSISWPRVLPKVDDRYPNKAGVDYYKKLIQKLLDNNIQPLVTMYHWDLPHVLQKLGGWTNPHIIGYFTNYAAFLFRTYGKQVKLWSTFNEPRYISLAYGVDQGVAPAIGYEFSGIGEYMATRNILLAHAAVYKTYNQLFRSEQQGEISLCVGTTAYLPENPDLEEHRTAVSRAKDFFIGMFIQPLVDGEFPKSVVDAINATNKRENLTMQRLLEFTEKEKEELKGSFDFLAINYYKAQKLRPLSANDYEDKKHLLDKDVGIKLLLSNDENWTDIFNGFTQVIDWIIEKYDNPKLFIAENGIDDNPNVDESLQKIKYHHGILTELNKALEKGVNIKGYCVWTFMDSLEWTAGYFKKPYGIYSVDFNDPNRSRAKKSSFEFFEKLFKTKTLPPII